MSPEIRPKSFGTFEKHAPGPGCSKADQLNPELALTFMSYFQLFGESFFAYFCFSKLTSSNVKFYRISMLNNTLEKRNTVNVRV